MEIRVRPVTSSDREWVAELLTSRWGSPRIDTRGRLLDALSLTGYVALRGKEPSGLVTLHREGNALEVVTLDARPEGKGVGTALLDAAVEHARVLGCSRVWLTTSNDNLRAQGFYARRGWRLVAVHRDAITRARLRKPEIPLEGHHGIPVRDEWEYELPLGDATAGEPFADLREQLGGTDIHLIDQIMKRRFEGGRRILDVGSGSGRNLDLFLRAGFDVHAADRDPSAIEGLRRRADRLAPRLSPENFRAAEADALPWEDASFDVVLCVALLHFARDEAHFQAMVRELWRVLRPGGLLFARLASGIGLEGLQPPVGGRRHLLPDGSERFLVDQPLLLDLTARLGGTLVEPIRTSNVQGLRCMTTWVVRRDD